MINPIGHDAAKERFEKGEKIILLSLAHGEEGIIEIKELEKTSPHQTFELEIMTALEREGAFTFGWTS